MSVSECSLGFSLHSNDTHPFSVCLTSCCCRAAERSDDFEEQSSLHEASFLLFAGSNIVFRRWMKATAASTRD